MPGNDMIRTASSLTTAAAILRNHQGSQPLNLSSKSLLTPAVTTYPASDPITYYDMGTGQHRLPSNTYKGPPAPAHTGPAVPVRNEKLFIAHQSESSNKIMLIQRPARPDSTGTDSVEHQSSPSDLESVAGSPMNSSFLSEKLDCKVGDKRALCDSRSRDMSTLMCDSAIESASDVSNGPDGLSSPLADTQVDSEVGVLNSSKRRRKPVDRYQIIHDYRGKKALSLDDYLSDELLLFSDMLPRSKKKERIRSASAKTKTLTSKVNTPSPVSIKSSTPKAKSQSCETSRLTEEELNSIKKALGEGIPYYDELAPSPAENRRRRVPPAFYQAPLATAKKRKSLSTSSATSSSQILSEPGTPIAVNYTELTDAIKRSKPTEIANVTKAILNTPEKDNSLDQSSASITKPSEEGVTVGRIVWAKLTARCKAWPAMTITGASAAQSAASADCSWVFWYGEHKVSEVQICRMEDFDVGFQAAYKAGSGQLYTTAVSEALKDCWRLLKSSTDGKTDEEQTIPEQLDLIDWANDTFDSSCSKLPNGKLTESVGKKLEAIVEMINSAEDSSEDESDAENNMRHNQSASKETASQSAKKHKKSDRIGSVQKVRNSELLLEDICLSCDRNRQNATIKEHPLFQGGLCKHCQDYVKDSFFSFGADGCMSYCVICGNGGDLLVCDTPTCGRTYCLQCVEILGSPDILKSIEQSDPWLCFLCDPVSMPDLLIKRREDWKQRLMSFYQKPSRLHNLPQFQPGRKLRVLSLFDGIGTAKVVLDNLKLDVEVYYSTEIEEDAIQVVNLNHGENILQLGDIRSLTEEKLSALGRIDLLVGGSPCNDLALVNPARKGLYDATGTGILFFDFYRILMTLMVKQSDPVLWLFENVVHMNKETKEAISRFLECEPVKLDAGVFSAQSRARYFWGNIPGMYCPISPEMMSVNICLQDVLSKGRNAAVRKIRTVTTRGASLLQGKNEDMHAVVMNGQSDKLWPTELERVFGLPVHYTDVGNLAPGKRQKLLGRSWCVPVIEYLLKPLTHLFAVRAEPKKCSCNCTCNAKSQ